MLHSTCDQRGGQGSYGVNIYNTAYILIVAYLVKYQLMGMRTVVSAMSQIHVSLEESSTISGANWLKTMTKITGPLIFPSIAAGWFCTASSRGARGCRS